MLSRACFTNASCREKERILQRWADLACDVLLSGQPWSSFFPESIAKGSSVRSPWTSYIEPSYIEPSYIEPSYIEPSYIEPSYIEPSYIEPSYIEPSYIEPSYIEPRLGRA